MSDRIYIELERELLDMARTEREAADAGGIPNHIEARRAAQGAYEVAVDLLHCAALASEESPERCKTCGDRGGVEFDHTGVQNCPDCSPESVEGEGDWPDVWLADAIPARFPDRKGRLVLWVKEPPSDIDFPTRRYIPAPKESER